MMREWQNEPSFVAPHSHVPEDIAVTPLEAMDYKEPATNGQLLALSDRISTVNSRAFTLEGDTQRALAACGFTLILALTLAFAIGNHSKRLERLEKARNGG